MRFPISEVDEGVLRLVFSYYKYSKSVLNIRSKNSDSFETSQDVKQSGVLSSLLLNFFMNDLLESNCALNLRAQKRKYNVCTLAFCDDIILLSQTAGHIKII